MNTQNTTMKVKINNEGYLESLDIKDATIEVAVDIDTYNKITMVKNGYNWRLVNETWLEVPLLDDNNLRTIREYSCFRLLDNKSALWYDNLTKEQHTELNNWYKAWLEVTDTKVIPEKPTWLK